MTGFNALVNTASIDDAKMVIRNVFETDPAQQTHYSWLLPVATDTTEAYIARLLTQDPPKLIYRIQELSENIRYASMHLDQALGRQDKLYELEIGAINTLIDDMVFDQNGERDERIALSNLRAVLSTAPANADNATEADIRSIYSTKRDIVAAKRQYRNAKGSALNVGDRIDFLRALQADTVRSMYERLLAVRLCMASSGIGKMPPVPTWSETAGFDNLRNLALWTRQAIRKVELAEPNERLVTLTIGTHDWTMQCYDANGQPLSKDDIIQRLMSPGYDDIAFVVDQALIKNKLAYSNYKSVRTVAMSVGVAFSEDEAEVKRLILGTGADMVLASARRDLIKEWRNRLKFGLRIVPPVQSALHDAGESATWQPVRIELDDEVGVAASVGVGSLYAVPARDVLNVNPLGRWVVSVNPSARTPHALSGTLSERPFGTDNVLANVAGIVFSLKLAFRY